MWFWLSWYSCLQFTSADQKWKLDQITCRLCSISHLYLQALGRSTLWLILRYDSSTSWPSITCHLSIYHRPPATYHWHITFVDVAIDIFPLAILEYMYDISATALSKHVVWGSSWEVSVHRSTSQRWKNRQKYTIWGQIREWQSRRRVGPSSSHSWHHF